MSSSSKFLLLACLYFSQGLPYGFFTQALPVLMRKLGASLPEIGLASLLSLPWMLKFMWAPFMDRYGQRRTWILCLQGLGVLLFLGLAWYSREQGYAYLMWGFLIASFIAATQDIATDGLAVNLLDDSERGFGNGLQVAGYRLGMVVGGGFILVIINVIMWKGAFLVMSALLVVFSLPLLFYKEPPRKAESQMPNLWKMIPQLVMRPGMWVWLLVIGFYKFGDAMTGVMLRPFLVDAGMTMAEIGILIGSYGFVGGLLGALGGGLLVKPMGRVRAIVFLGLSQTLPVFAYAMISSHMLPESWLTAVVFAEYFTGGLATVALFTAMMDVCDPETGGTDYTVQASVVVLCTGASHALSGFTAESLGYSGNFLIAGGLCLLGVLIFAGLYRTQWRDQDKFRLSQQS